MPTRSSKAKSKVVKSRTNNKKKAAPKPKRRVRKTENV